MIYIIRDIHIEEVGRTFCRRARASAATQGVIGWHPPSIRSDSPRFFVKYIHLTVDAAA